MIHRRFLISVIQRRNLSAVGPPTSTASVARMEQFKMPLRFKRKPTDLLKALASTVKEDPTGHSYVYVDDPHFIPSKPFEAQNFAVSKEFGKKAARYFASQYPTLFMYDEDVPRLAAFRPIQRPTSESADDEESLNDRIDRLWVKSAVAVYENAVAHQRPISTATRLKLLELLVFYNHEEPNELPESAVEIWSRSFAPLSMKPEWTDDGVAMKIYDALPEPKDPRATAAIICGMLKHFAVEKGYELWQLSREVGGKLTDARVYECLIKYGVERLKAVNAERWDLILELFRAMADDGVKPTLGVFNAAFCVLSKGSRWKRTEESAKNLFREMFLVDVKPSMGTFYYILRIFDKRPSLGSVVSAILSHLERNTSNYAFSDEADGKFFVEAMIQCCEQLHDRELVLRLHRLLKTGDNYLYMTEAIDEVKYYRSMLQFLSYTEDSKTFFEQYYHRATPRYFIPDGKLILNCLNNIEVSSSYEYLPSICTDLITYHHVFRRDVLLPFLDTLSRALTQEMTIQTLETFSKMGKDIHEKLVSKVPTEDMTAEKLAELSEFAKNIYEKIDSRFRTLKKSS